MLIQYERVSTVATRAGYDSVVVGWQIETEEGHSVNRLDKGKYEIVLTGQKLNSDDPAAP
jgi:hypothetical protein